MKHIELLQNEKDDDWDNFFPLAEHGWKGNGWLVRLARTIDGKTFEVYFPNNDISNFRGG